MKSVVLPPWSCARRPTPALIASGVIGLPARLMRSRERRTASSSVLNVLSRHIDAQRWAQVSLCG
jgi:hypothetical protein